MPIRRSGNSAAVYETVREFPSQSKPGKFYRVKRKIATGELSCNCPVWIFSGRNRNCDHVRAVTQEGGAPSSVLRPSSPAPRAQRAARPPSEAYVRVGSIGGYTVYRNYDLEPPGYFCGCAAFGRDRECRHVEQAVRLGLGEAIATEYRSEPCGTVDDYIISRVVGGVFTSRRGVMVRDGFLCECSACQRDGTCAHVAEFERLREEQRREYEALAEANITAAALVDDFVNQGLDFTLRRREGMEVLVLSYVEINGSWLPGVTVNRGDYYCTCGAFREFGACPHVRAQMEVDAAFARYANNSTIEPDNGRANGQEQERSESVAVIVVKAVADADDGDEGWRRGRRGGIAVVDERWE